MKSRFLYMKFLGLLLVIAGFSYSITSFNNFFSYIFHTRIFSENLNIYLMSIGLIIPLAMFIYGVFFYFYTDFNITKINKFIFIFNIIFLIIGLIMLVIKQFNFLPNFLLFQIFEFLHKSYTYPIILLSILGLYGCFKYKY